MRKIRKRLLPLMLLMLTTTITQGAVDFLMEGGNLLEQKAGERHLEVRPGETKRERVSVAVEPETEYFFSAETLSEGRVVFSLAGLSMSYHHQGDWQQVCGLVRSGDRRELELVIEVRSLQEGKPAAAELRNLVLQKVERPREIKSLPRDGRTLLTEGSKAVAAIIYPETTGDALAKALQEKIHEKTSVMLPILSDREVTTEAAPVIREEYRNRPLIVIGQLATNRAIWPAYNRFLAAEDGYYPGGNGFVVRTAADVYRNGYNHVILGGSSSQGVERAVQELISRLPELTPDGSGRFYLPWLLKVELDGECSKAFAVDEESWEDPSDSRLPVPTSGYGKVVRWYRNAMGYYWSGDTRYLNRSKDYLKEILAERSHTHHYIVEFFIRTYEMLDESPALDTQEIAALDSLVLQNFLDFLTITDLSWMTTFSPPYEALTITNRHQISPWYADLIMARFLKRHLPLSGHLKALVDFRYSEKEALFRSMVSGRNGPSLPGIAAESDYEEFPAMLFRYALENEHYDEFFGSGLAHQTLALERLDHTSGRLADPPCAIDLPMWLGAMAHLSHDGRYQWLAERIEYTGLERPFQGRYVAGVHRYQAEIALQKPSPEWAGIRVAPQPLLKDQTEENDRERFPLITMRGGFEQTDDLLMLAGWHRNLPAGSIVTFVVDGVSLLKRSGEQGAFNRSVTNGANVVRLDSQMVGGPNMEEEGKGRLDWKGEFPLCSAASIGTTISSGVEWTREVVRIANGEYLFCDTLVASRPGNFLLSIAWQPRYSPKERDGRWTMTTSKGQVSFLMLGDGFRSRYTEGALRCEAVRAMKKGESISIWTLVQREGPNGGKWSPELTGNGSIRLSPKNRDLPLAIQRNASIRDTEAGLVVSSGSEAIAFGLKEGSNAVVSKTVSPNLIKGEPPKEKAGANFAAPNTVVDASAFWKERWRYEGFLKPALIHAKEVADGIYDLGEVFTLAEVRSVVTRRGSWLPGYLPKDIRIAPESAKTAPPKDSALWKALSGERKGREGVKTGNYGEAAPVDHADESLFPEGYPKTRFVLVNDPVPGNTLRFFAAESLAARHPLRLIDLSTIPGSKADMILAAPDIFPQFTRPIRDDDFSLALLNPGNGEAIAEVAVSGPVQAVLAADQRGTGELELFVLKANATIETYGLDGKAREPINLYDQFVNFQKTHGRTNTRAPAGGHYMPFSIGLWRADETGARRFVIGRYGSLAFLNPQRELEGLLSFPSYAAPAMLEQGVDFNGDGKDEMLVLEMYRMIHAGGEATPKVRDDGRFWPQVYEVMAARPPEGSATSLLSGPPVHAFQVLARLGGSKRYTFVARNNYVGIYDAVDRKWAVSWSPSAPISAACLTGETEERMTFSLATSDGLFWEAIYDIRRKGRMRVSAGSGVVGLTIRDIRFDAESGSELLVAEEGLYLKPPKGALEKLAPGSYHRALFQKKDSIIATDDQGNVIGFERKP